MKIKSFLLASAITAITTLTAQALTLKIDYDVAFVGLPIGTVNLSKTINGADYNTTIKAKASGMAKMFSGGWANIEANGVVGSTRLHGKQLNVESKGKEVIMTTALQINKDNVVSFTQNPPKDPNPEILPLTDEHKKNIIDPLAAMFLVVGGLDPILSPTSCNKVQRVFTGNFRADFTTTFISMEDVSFEGYEGKALKCKIQMKAIAGHKGEKGDAKETEKMPITAWFVPISKTRMLVPYKVEIQHKFGRGIMEVNNLKVSQ